jgi:hypothetical protein
MRIRIMQYSLSIRDLIIAAIGIFVILLGFTYIGPFRFVGIIFLFLSFALAARVAAFWFTWDGPVVGEPKRDSIIALGYLAAAIVLFLI